MSGGRPLTNESVSVGALAGSSPGALVARTARRATSVRIAADDLLPPERNALELADPPVTDPALQAFLAWRRALLFAIIALAAPLALVQFIDALRGPSRIPTMMRLVGIVPALATAFLCAWSVLAARAWTTWSEKQRRAIAVGYLVFLLAPFVTYLYPLRSSLPGSGDGGEAAAGFGFLAAMQGLLVIAPRVVTLLPGVVRAGMVTKLLFPGSAVPGWAIVVAAPVSILIMFLAVFVPLQVSGSGWFVLVLLGAIAAQVLLVRAAWPIVRPGSEAHAASQLGRVRVAYLAANGAAAFFLIFAVHGLAKTFGGDEIAVFIGFADTVTVLLTMAVNLLALTLIGTDHAITTLDRARVYGTLAAQDVEATRAKLAHYAGSSPPPAPSPPAPPPGPSGLA